MEDGSGCWNRLSIHIDTIGPHYVSSLFIAVEFLMRQRSARFFIARRKALEMIGLSDQLESAEMLIQAHLDYREARDGLSTFEDD